MGVIVDTNVARVASGHSPQADAACASACVQRLYEIMEQGGLLVDSLGLILNEYIKGLGHAGTPGAGEKFVKWAYSQQWQSDKVTRVAITPTTNEGWRKYKEFPDQPALKGFDPSDQKFVAVAVASGTNPPILNAVDSDWWNHRQALTNAGIVIEFVCPQHAPTP